MEEYKVIGQLGSGATSIAYLVECKQNNQKYVIKEIPLDQLDPITKKNVVYEIAIVKNLKHDNIIKIFNATVNNGKLDILMEYANGGTLREYLLKKKRLSEDEIIDLFVQICLAVKYIHDRKIIHRDLKTSNIFLLKNKIIKLGDFGFAKALNSTCDQAKTQLGTPYYSSPEICTGKPYSTPSDIWALGIILYEMCTLRYPFVGKDIPSLVKQIIESQPPKIQSIYCPELRNLCKSMLQKNPSQRPTILEILSLPILKYKAIALLGEKEAVIELNHSTFHGFNAGVTPTEFKKDVDFIQIHKPKKSEFHFMGKPLQLEETSSNQEKADYVRNFIFKLTNPCRFSELAKYALSEDEIPSLPKSEEYIIDLIKQLNDFVNKHNLKKDG